MLHKWSEVVLACGAIMVTSFTRARAQLEADEVALIEKLLDQWYRHPSGRIIAVNLRDREHFLSTASMVSLIRTLIANKDVDFDALAKRYEKACHQHQLKGGPIQLAPFPEQLGRAVDTSKFLQDLTKHPYLSFVPSARDFLTRLVQGGSLSSEELGILMSPYTAWVTWDELNPNADPFGFIIHGLAVEVRAALGLDPRVSGPLLLLRYECPQDLTLHRSTIADAGLHPFFDPPPLSMTAHSFTRPWPPELLQRNTISGEFHLPPRPEAVHEAAEVRHLSRPITELR
jgi:hypothetical protein